MKILVLFLVLVTFFVEAKDLGVFGETFKIIEKDLLEHIKIRLVQMQQDGSLEIESNKIKEKILVNVRTPQAVENIKHTETERTFEYDPTVELTRDLTDHKGNVFAKKGDRFNPLDMVSLSKPLLFIDGNENTHIKWANAKINKNNLCRIILVKGSPLDLRSSFAPGKELGRDIFFDQHGTLTTKLGIKNVPAIVFQKEGEKVLTVREEKATAEETI